MRNAIQYSNVPYSFLLHLVSSSANTDFSQLEQALQYAIDVENTIQICITYTKSF